MGMDSISQRGLKVYFLPFMAQGHLIPLSQFARLFAARGLHVTIITTPLNARFLEDSMHESKSLGHHIHIHTVEFPSDEVGLPVDVENLFAVSDDATADKLYAASALLQRHVDPFIQQNPPDCLVSDFLYPWTAHIATRLRIPRLVFNSFCLFAVCAANAVNRQRKLSQPDPFPFVVSSLPDPITLPLPPPELNSKQLEILIEAFQQNSQGLIVNNFEEMDGQDYIQHYQNTTGLKVWHIGPASFLLRNTLNNNNNNNKSVAPHAHDRIRSWLDSKHPNSIVYISFGSLCRFNDAQLYEIARGIEASEHSFIWVVHKEKEESAWFPRGFEERVVENNRGMILRGWAPQELILNHPATGGFMTQCGWTSVTEAISAGVPMMTWPVFIEQFYNEKLITEVHGIGVEVGAEEWNSSPYEAMKKVVSWVKIEKAVRRLMDGGDEAERLRKRAREMADKATRAVNEGGSSHNNLTTLIQHLQRLALNQ